MRVVFGLFLFLHGVIHFLGVARAFRLAELPQLTQPVSAAMGIVWLCAGMLFVATSAALFFWPRGWWMIGAAAIVLSMVAIVSSWTDAKFGALANALALVGVVYAFQAYGPASLWAEYERDVAAGLARGSSSALITDADLTPLPSPVQRYLRLARVVGQPRVRSVFARMHGRIRSGPASPWMPFTAEQYDFFDQPSRFFYMDASMWRLPVHGYHRYVGPSATMLVKLAALVPVAHEAGDAMTTAETVTLFNDMCLLAPATLVEPSIRWESVDGNVVRAAFTNAGHTIRADLVFNDAGELVNFVSEDRRRSREDGQGMTRIRWSTPMTGYRLFGATRIAARGDGRWHEVSGEYAYIEIEIDDVRYNMTGAVMP